MKPIISIIANIFEAVAASWLGMTDDKRVSTIIAVFVSKFVKLLLTSRIILKFCIIKLKMKYTIRIIGASIVNVSLW